MVLSATGNVLSASGLDVLSSVMCCEIEHLWGVLTEDWTIGSGSDLEVLSTEGREVGRGKDHVVEVEVVMDDDGQGCGGGGGDDDGRLWRICIVKDMELAPPMAVAAAVAADGDGGHVGSGSRW
ncbi:hypothetical protein L6452_34125 [Arctium lappa]|uniref:Uncharacterized protein n=1 Tax=Arctium lappa TaxID=4217 RepID=A0ACB8YHZ9_ARCLA|nr:hypothetical protein L6452_34125 [Arctium lappa]